MWVLNLISKCYKLSAKLHAPSVNYYTAHKLAHTRRPLSSIDTSSEIVRVQFWQMSEINKMSSAGISSPIFFH